MNEQPVKTSGADVLSSWKKTQKNLGGGGGLASTPLVLSRVKTKDYIERRVTSPTSRVPHRHVNRSLLT